jgi:WD40 repeat protein
VKLLKRQFGLPSDLLSLKSLSINKADANENTSGGVHGASTSSKEIPKLPQIEETGRFSFGGVKHIYDQHSEAVTRIAFAHNDDSTLVATSMDGRISVCTLDDASDFVSLCGHTEGVLDVDVSDSNQFLVSCSLDGTLALWDLKTKAQLRATRIENGYVTFCRFLPKNNNLVVCGVSGGCIRLMNVSTGKFLPDVSSPVLGKSLCAQINQHGSVLWVGSDRGYVESFRLVDSGGKVAKGCRVQVDQHHPHPVLSLSSTMSGVTRGPCLLVGLAGSSDLRLFRIRDEFGTIEPLMRFSSGIPTTTSTFAPILTYPTCVAAGAEDGTLLFFDLSRPQSGVVNKLLGHSKPVIALAFSSSERFLASADTAGQIIVWKK